MRFALRSLQRVLAPVGNKLSTVSEVSTAFPRPNPGELLSISALRAKLRSGFPIELWRAPREAVFDRLSDASLDGSAPSRARALRYSKGRQVAGQDMCAIGDSVCPLGAPPVLSQYKEAWGGISVFASDNAFGANAISFAKSYLAGLAGIPCKSTCDPTVSCDAVTRESVVFVHDRVMGRTPKVLEADGASPSNIGDLVMSGEGSGSCALVHHLLITVRTTTPTSEINRIATCEDWAQPDTTGSRHSSSIVASSSAAAIRSNVAALDSPSAVDDPEVADETLSSVCELLLLLVPFDGTGGRLDLALEALLYVYLFKHCQAYFGGHLDRVVSLDAGRCAELLLAAEACAFPAGDYGHGEWAHSCLPPIIEACHAFLLIATDVELQANLQVFVRAVFSTCYLAPQNNPHPRTQTLTISYLNTILLPCRQIAYNIHSPCP